MDAGTRSASSRTQTRDGSTAEEQAHRCGRTRASTSGDLRNSRAEDCHHELKGDTGGICEAVCRKVLASKADCVVPQFERFAAGTTGDEASDTVQCTSRGGESGFVIARSEGCHLVSAIGAAPAKSPTGRKTFSGPTLEG